MITILHGGRGLPNLLQYYKGEGGVSRDPKFVLRNIWTAPYYGHFLQSTSARIDFGHFPLSNVCACVIVLVRRCDGACARREGCCSTGACGGGSSSGGRYSLRSALGLWSTFQNTNPATEESRCQIQITIFLHF